MAGSHRLSNRCICVIINQVNAIPDFRFKPLEGL